MGKLEELCQRDPEADDWTGKVGWGGAEEACAEMGTQLGKKNAEVGEHLFLEE